MSISLATKGMIIPARTKTEGINNIKLFAGSQVVGVKVASPVVRVAVSAEAVSKVSVSKGSQIVGVKVRNPIVKIVVKVD